MVTREIAIFVTSATICSILDLAMVYSAHFVTQCLSRKLAQVVVVALRTCMCLDTAKY